MNYTKIIIEIIKEQQFTTQQLLVIHEALTGLLAKRGAICGYTGLLCNQKEKNHPPHIKKCHWCGELEK